MKLISVARAASGAASACRLDGQTPNGVGTNIEQVAGIDADLIEPGARVPAVTGSPELGGKIDRLVDGDADLTGGRGGEGPGDGVIVGRRIDAGRRNGDVEPEPNTIEYKVGEIFGEIRNKITSGYNLREIIDHIDELRFRSQTEKHTLSHLYEEKIKRMGNAGRNGGEYYTPRPLIRAMVQVVQPKIGETIYDGACGSAGFLCESFEF
jgi:hypothetical protein